MVAVGIGVKACKELAQTAGLKTDRGIQLDEYLQTSDPDTFAAGDDAHQGQFGDDCSMCHTTSAWLPATFDHSLTNFPLTGAHTGLACSQCHVNADFVIIDTAGASCHPDPPFHTGLFEGITRDQCHTTTAWIPASFSLSHPNSCGDVICINHEAATCRDCHTVNLATATCLECHVSNNPGDEGEDN